mmetsp:Transcript_34439/g.91530  ORF Transcript_34439/g.91530 Transcript_34439/m.91530 type:complete len:1020 (-) Transcript_34439:89-3148(-)
MAVGGGLGGSFSARLTPHQVSLCSLLVVYMDLGDREPGTLPPTDEEQAAERHLFEVLFREVRASSSAQPRHKALSDLKRDFLQSAPTSSSLDSTLWKAFVKQLQTIDSPDELFNLFATLEGSIARDPGESSPMHSTGLFGQFARRCILAFKAASFESAVKLFDAVCVYVRELDESEEASLPDMTAPTPSSSSSSSCGSEPSVGALLQQLMRDLPQILGAVSFPRIDAALRALQDRCPSSQGVLFLRYANSLQHKMADQAGRCLRAFHDGTQRRGLGDACGEEGLPDLIQHASLALAGLHCEMRQVDDALQALGESIRSAQEASDAGCLCACLYMLSIVLLQAGLTGKAFAMLQRCLHRSEAIGSPILQSLCCLGIARALAERPTLSDRRQRGLLWQESMSRMSRADHAGGGAVLRSRPGGGGAGGAQGGGIVGGGGAGLQVAGGVGAGAAPGAAAFRGPLGGFLGGVGSASSGAGRGGLVVLAALLQDEAAASSSGGAGGSFAEGSASSSAGASGIACRDALSHTVLASQLSTQARRLSESRPKALLCHAEVARLFGLQQLAGASCGLALEVYEGELAAEERALALCQLTASAAECDLARVRPLMRSLSCNLPHASHLWAHVVGPCVIKMLLSVGECTAASALLFQAVSALRAVPHGAATCAAQRLRSAANGVRLHHRQLLAAHRSASEALEGGQRTGSPADICSQLLCLADVHLEAKDPIGALGPCLRCLAAAQASRLLMQRAEALVRIARVKLEMRDLVGALLLAEEVTPQLSAGGSAKLKGEALVVQADVLLATLAKLRPGPTAKTAAPSTTPPRLTIASRDQLLREVLRLLSAAVKHFEVVAELAPLKRCHYLLARVCHELRDTAGRDRHATRFRRISESLTGGSASSRESLGLARVFDSPKDSEAREAGRGGGGGVASEVKAASLPELPRDGQEPQAPSRPSSAALARLLALAEQGGGGMGVRDPVAMLFAPPPRCGEDATSGAGGRTGFASLGVETAIGHVPTLYPMATSLRA